jgi:hypothetical protein
VGAAVAAGRQLDRGHPCPLWLPACGRLSEDMRQMIHAEQAAETDSSPIHRGWHSRGYLPHCDYPGLLQSITFCLADAVPADMIADWKEELGLLESIASRAATRHRDDDRDTRAAELHERIARYEDMGHGACWLRDERIAGQVEKALLYFDGERYRLLAWCVMPNHVHALGTVVHSWKSFTALEANRTLGRGGSFWMPDYYDRFIRDEEHLAAAVAYIEGNPVKQPDDWRFSSAARRGEGDA